MSEGADLSQQALDDAAAAVVVVDLDRRQVVHANRAALALAPGVSLPAAADDWARTVGLSADGVATVGRIVDGTAVVGAPATRADRRVWVTGFPVTGSPQALVALFDQEAEGLLERSVVAAGLSFTISDPALPDDPLVFVNPAFERTTGYSREEVLGRNCRFLQCDETDRAAVARLREGLDREEHVTVTLLNQRKDGSRFWNELSISPVYDGDGRLTHFVGIQADVTARVVVERERERHLAAEQSARAQAELAQRRLALLAEATSMLAATLDVDEALDRLTRLVVPLLADWCTVHLVATDGRVQRVAAAHRDESKQALLRRIEELQPAGLDDRSETAGVLRGGPPVLLPEVSWEAIERAVTDPELREVYRELAVGSMVLVPLRARRQVLGVLGMFADTRAFDEEDLRTAADLARRAALAVDNARLYQQEHDVAEALQRAMLPALPSVPGLDVAARYLPSASAAQVGGDWYDVLPLPDGAVGLAVGDVMGHDLVAAAAMGQLRSVLRAYSWQLSDPAVVLDAVDQLVQGLDVAHLATAVYARLQDGALTWANAGHLPPVLRTPDGQVRLLEDARSLLVGAALGTSRTNATVDVPPGSVLVLYTDGLVEHRGLDLDLGLDALQRVLAEAPASTADALCDRLVDALTTPDRDDDVALLVVRVTS